MAIRGWRGTGLVFQILIYRCIGATGCSAGHQLYINNKLDRVYAKAKFWQRFPGHRPTTERRFPSGVIEATSTLLWQAGLIGKKIATTCIRHAPKMLDAVHVWGRTTHTEPEVSEIPHR